MRLLLIFLSLFSCLSKFTPANAIPANTQRQPQNEPRMITLPLKSLHNSRGANLLQQHINRASRRLAHVTRHEARSEHTLRSLSTPNNQSICPQTSSGGGSDSAVNGTTSNCNGTNTGVSPLDLNTSQMHITESITPSTPNSLGLDIQGGDIGYISTIYIGTPPRPFYLLMDSGSPDFWVDGWNITGNHSVLGTISSSTFIQGTQEFSISYGSGYVEGLLCQDNVYIAGLELKNHVFGIASNVSDSFSQQAPYDGILGFGLAKLSSQHAPTVLQSLAANKLIPAPVASFKISRLSDQLNDGEVVLGGLDPSKFIASTLTTVPNLSDGYWEAQLDDVTVNGTSINLPGRTAVLDTGTTVIAMPPADAQQVMQSLGGACDSQQCNISCTTQASLAFTFGNTSFAIDPRDLAYYPLDPNNPAGDCQAGIQPYQSESLGSRWLFGDVFLKNAYFSINAATNQISLARLVAD